MRVRGVEHDLVRVQIVLLFKSRFEGGINTAGHTEGVGGDDHRAFTFGILKRQCLGPERMQHALAFLRAPTVAGHPDGFLRRDIRLGRAGFPCGGGERKG